MNFISYSIQFYHDKKSRQPAKHIMNIDTKKDLALVVLP